MPLDTKSNVQKEGNTLARIKGNQRIKWKQQLNNKK